MVAIDRAQFSGTNGTSVPAGTPFYLNLTMRNTSVLDQEYNVKVIYSDGDPTSQGTKIASVVVMIPSAAVGGSQSISIPLNVTAPEGTKMKLYLVAFPHCPSKRMPSMDCSNMVYPVGTLTVTRQAGQGYGVAYPGKTWMGQPLRSYIGRPFATQAEVMATIVATRAAAVKAQADQKAAAEQAVADYNARFQEAPTSTYTSYTSPTQSPDAASSAACNCKIPIAPYNTDHRNTLQMLIQAAYRNCNYDDMRDLGIVLPQGGDFVPCDYPGGEAQYHGGAVSSVADRRNWWNQVMNTARSAYAEWTARGGSNGCPGAPPAISAAPAVPVVPVAPQCTCDLPNCFKKGDKTPSNAKRSHSDLCGNTIVDEWCPTCDPAKCFDQKPPGVKTYTRDACGKIVVTEWCDVNCPKSPTDPIIQARFPGSKILDFATDVCKCVIPKIRQLSAEEIENLNKQKAQAKGGRVVIGKRTVVIENQPAGSPTGFAMSIEQTGVLPIYAPPAWRKKTMIDKNRILPIYTPNISEITAPGSSKSDYTTITTDNPNPKINLDPDNNRTNSKTPYYTLGDPQHYHTVLTTDEANPTVNLNVQSGRVQNPLTLDDLTVGPSDHTHVSVQEDKAGSTAGINITGRKVRGGYFSPALSDNLPPAFSSTKYIPGVYAPEIPSTPGERDHIYAPGTAPVKKRT